MGHVIQLCANVCWCEGAKTCWMAETTSLQPGTSITSGSIHCCCHPALAGTFRIRLPLIACLMGMGPPGGCTHRMQRQGRTMHLLSATDKAFNMLTPCPKQSSGLLNMKLRHCSRFLVQ